MNFCEVLDFVKKQISPVCPTFMEYDEKISSEKEKNIAVIALKELNCNQNDLWTANVGVSILSKDFYSGAKIISVSEKITDSVMKSGVNVTGVSAKSLYFNEKLQRLCYELEFSVKAGVDDGFDFSKSIPTINICEDIDLTVTDWVFERKRGFSELCTSVGIIEGDKGLYPLSVSIKGKIDGEKNLVLKKLDDVISQKISCQFDFLENSLPPLYLVDYIVSVNTYDKSTEVQLKFCSQLSDGRVTALE